MSFEILRDMEAFTQEMFNGIISFQEREHPAWDESADFQSRIQKLPLHYLMFSNADRDPEKHGPTIAHFYPLKYEMEKIAALAKQVATNPVICDAHARNGFVGSLLAQEGLKVIGLRDTENKPNQIENFFDQNKYEMNDGSLIDSDIEADVIFSSWMPAGENLTDVIIKKNPKMVVYIFTEHKNQFSGERQTGVEEAFGETLPASYKLIEEWSVTRPENLFHDIWPDITANIEESRIVKIYANEGFHDISTELRETDAKSYDWEQELQVAQTAHKAKQQMKSQGFPLDF